MLWQFDIRDKQRTHERRKGAEDQLLFFFVVRYCAVHGGAAKWHETGRMRHFASHCMSCSSASASPSPSPLSSSLSRRSALRATGLLRSWPLMNFRGVHSAPIQSNRNATTADAALHDRFHSQSLSDGEISQRQIFLQQLGGGVGGGAAAGGRGFSSGTREVNSGWNPEQQDEQRTPWRGQREQQRWPERRAWRNEESTGSEDALNRSVRGGATTGPVGGGWSRGRGGRGEGRFTSMGRGGGRGGWRGGRGDWRYQVKRNDSDRRAIAEDFRGGDGAGVTRSQHDEDRYWCSAENEPPAAAHEKFVLVSYNILADKNAWQHYNELYHHVPHRLMYWDRRKTKLVEELGLWNPDIMCLQEVDKYKDLQQEFEQMGYSGAFKNGREDPAYSQSEICKQMKGRTGGARDGCAMFWKTTRFRLLEELNIQFNELDLRDNVAQLCVFQSIAETEEQEPNSKIQPLNSGYKRGQGNLVIVGNIHVLFNPKRGDVKLGQVRVLLDSAHALSEKYGGAPVTIAGDFNSTPTSDVYKFLATSELDISCLNRATMSGQVEASDGAPVAWMSQMGQGSSSDSTGINSPNSFARKRHWFPEELMAATGTLDCTELRHNLNLRSAYSQIKGEAGCRNSQGEPLVTTCHRKFMGTVDYIWHTEGIDTVKVLDTLPVPVLQRSQGLPSRKWGSDHLALACELAFLPSSEPEIS